MFLSVAHDSFVDTQFSAPLTSFFHVAAVVLLDSFDSVEDVGLSSQEKATPKAKAPPEITDDGPAETGKVCEALTLL